MYRAGIHALMLCGCIGVNGGGLAHYVGQEKLAPGESWGTLAFGKDWGGPPRLQNAPSWHYVNTDQWRYERSFTDYHTVPQSQNGSLAKGHTMDMQVRAVRGGWLPFYPQFDRNTLELVAEAKAAGAESEKEIVDWVVDRLKSRELKFAVEDPDAPENWPRVWYIWRGNALMSSAKGHEYFLKHYLGTHTNAVREEDLAEGSVKDVRWREAPHGKMDLVVDLNFRMDTSALYSDIVLPAATWYEKADLNSTDMHSFIHPLAQAVPPCWESKSDWQIFRAIAEKFSELAAPHFPEPVDDLVAAPLAHDTPAEIAQPEIRSWIDGEVEAIPGKTMPGLKVVQRDYANLYNASVRTVRRPEETVWGLTARVMRSRTSTTNWPRNSRAARLGRQELSRRSRRRRGGLQPDLQLASVTNGELGLPLLQKHGGQDRSAAGASGGEEPQCPHHLQGYPEPTADGSSTARCGRG